MQFAISFGRVVFILLSMLFFASYMSNGSELTSFSLSVGALTGLIFASLVMGLDLACKRFDLRSFNLAALGLFFGFLMGEAIVTLFNAMMNAQILQLSAELSALAKMSIFLFSAYFGISLTLRASDELCVSIPFIRFQQRQQKRKDILLDISILSDPRLIDLANSGLLDQQLIVPRFAVKELHMQAESSDES